MSDAVAGPVGYSFRNYEAPEDDWGIVATADDMRYTWMFGIDAVAQDLNQTRWEDSQFDYYVDGAMAEFETYLTIDIRKRIYKTPSIGDPSMQLLDGLTRKQRFGPGVDYTDLENSYPYIPGHWKRYGFVQLRKCPVISIEQAVLLNPLGGELIDLVSNNWLRISNRNTGMLHFYPQGSALTHTPYSGCLLYTSPSPRDS